ncbi:MAG: zf-HC2 domain-containing protein [Lachnospiraceae bacterium]|nr:zf-HC2 domain-containing protein [Lachnospiraceae bacterium]
MDCKSFEKKIPDFLADRLSISDLSEFLEHFDRCAECREELSIQFLVAEGMPRLETGANFHLQNELAQVIAAARTKAGKRKRLAVITYSIEIITILIMLASLATAWYYF